MTRKPQFVTLVAVAAALALAACSSSSGGEDTSPSPSPSASPSRKASPSPGSGKPQNIEFDAELSGAYSKMNTAGPDDEITYGYSQLDGYTKINGKSVRVRMQGLFDQAEGSGPLAGFLELRWSDGSTLAFRQTGTVEADKSSNRVEFKADLTAIGGTDDMDAVTGTGTYTGSRKSSSGSTIRIAVHLALQGAPASIVGTAASAIPSSSYAATIEP